MFVYRMFPNAIWIVGHYRPVLKPFGNGQMALDYLWEAESDHPTSSAAAERVNYLNGGPGIREVGGWADK